MIKPFSKTLRVSMEACFTEGESCEKCMFANDSYPGCYKKLIKLAYETMWSLDHRRELAKRKVKQQEET